MSPTAASRRPRLFAVSALLAVVMALAATTGVQFAAAPPAAALDNGLVTTPPMGFNDWNAFGCKVSEKLIERSARILVRSGLAADGYTYVNIDDCWMESRRGPHGHLVPNPHKFPDGIAGTAAYVHRRGLKLGIYEDAGARTCAGYPGSLGHERIDARDFAKWGVDYLKYDNCSTRGDGSLADYESRYRAMRNALAATGRPIVLSVCEWGRQHPQTWADAFGNLWRTTADIKDNWHSLKSIVSQNAPLARYAGPGAWNDPDMLEVGNGGMTTDEYRTQFSLWAEMAAPLLIGTDLHTLSHATRRILGNRAIIAVDQDRLGVQGHVIAQHGATEVFDKPLANGDRAVALYNSGNSAAKVTTTAARTGIHRAHTYRLRHLWTGAVTRTTGTISVTVPAHGTVMYRVSDAAGRSRATAATVGSVGHLPG
jgi:alpha-galactosidase